MQRGRSDERGASRRKAGDVVVPRCPPDEVVTHRDQRGGGQGDNQTDAAEGRPFQMLAAEHDAAGDDQRAAGHDRDVHGLVEEQKGGHRRDQRRSGYQ